MNQVHRSRIFKFSLLGLLSLISCEQKMARQPYQRPFTPNSFFSNGTSSRSLVPHTIPHSVESQPESRSKDFKDPLISSSPPVTKRHLKNGKQKYEIFCSPCHGLLGDGRGFITERGMLNPPSFHSEEFKRVTPQHIYDVITHGYGAMFSYASRLQPKDRWAVISYIQALQLSQSVPLKSLPPGDQKELEVLRK